MIDTSQMQPFVPQHEPMVVLTVRIPSQARRALKAFQLRDTEECLRKGADARYGSVSQVVQAAIDEFLARNA